MKFHKLDYCTGICLGLGIGSLIVKAWPQINLNWFSACFFFLAAGLLAARSRRITQLNLSHDK
jgi:hypothetical protein